MSGFLQDVRYGLRQLRRKPAFTSVALLTIALGIGANVSIFTFIDALFLRNVPAKHPARLVRVSAPEGVSYPEYVYLRDHTRTVSSLIGHYSTAPLYLGSSEGSGEVQGAVVSSVVRHN